MTGATEDPLFARTDLETSNKILPI